MLYEMRGWLIVPSKSDALVMLPINIKRLILNCQKIFSNNGSKRLIVRLFPHIG